ncbi:hypothetical protein [Pseudomonas sp. MHK4]
MPIIKAFLVTLLLGAGLISYAGIAQAEGDIAKDVRDGVRDVDKDVERDGKDIDKEAKELDKERHKEDRHLDKEEKKASLRGESRRRTAFPGQKSALHRFGATLDPKYLRVTRAVLHCERFANTIERHTGRGLAHRRSRSCPELLASVPLHSARVQSPWH